jgi:hypothetical protein
MTEEEINDWERVHPSVFRDAGLVYMVNKFVLWPLGMELRVAYWDDITDEAIEIFMLKNPEMISEVRINVDREPGGCHPQERFFHFSESRVLLMPTEMEREMAAKALRRLLPGFGISPIRE